MPLRLRVFLDANILFSACRSAGAVRELLRQVQAAGHSLVADGYVMAEARRNLETKADAHAVAVLEALQAHVELLPARERAQPMPELDWLHEKDQPVLMAAIQGHCHVLVTGDRRHFGAAWGKRFGPTLLVSPSDLFQLISSSGIRHETLQHRPDRPR